MEIKKGNLRAVLEWEIPAQIARKGDVVTISSGIERTSLFVRGRVYGDPAFPRKGVYLLAGTPDDPNAFVNATDAAHIPDVTGTGYSNGRQLTLGKDGSYKIYAMLIYCTKTGDAKDFWNRNPGERVHIGTIVHEGQSAPIIPPVDTDSILEWVTDSLKTVVSKEGLWRLALSAAVIGGGIGAYNLQISAPGRRRL